MSNILKSTTKSITRRLNTNISTINNIPEDINIVTSLSFSKDERLCSIISITQLYETGKGVMGFPLRATFNVVEPQTAEQPRAKVLCTVSKKRFKRANKRNLLRRRIKESYRLQKASFYSRLAQLGFHIEFSINYITNDELDFDAINKGMEKLLSKIIKSLQSNPPK